jgi:hypothetical protein
MDNVIDVNIPKFWLEQEYVVKQRSMQEIAFDLGISAQIVYKILCTYGIQVRTNQYARKHLSIDKDWLIEEYVNKRRSTTDISKELNCGYNTINRRLREYGIVVRDNGKPQKTELLGQTFGKWTVLCEIPGKTEHHSCQWKCQCVCGQIKTLSTYTLTSGASKGCLTCDIAQTQAEKHVITSYYWGSLQSSAKKRGLDFAVTKDYVADLYEKQGRRCALTGLRLNMADTHCAWREGKQTASLDRINSLMTYEDGNVQWVHKMVNLAKWDMPQEEFIRVCHLVAKLHPMEIEEEVENPEISIDDEETSEWDSDLWRWVDERVKQKQIEEA